MKKKFDKSQSKPPVTFTEKIASIFSNHLIRIFALIGALIIIVICVIIFWQGKTHNNDEGKIIPTQRETAESTVTSTLGDTANINNSWIDELKSNEHFTVSTDSSGNIKIGFKVSDIPSSPPNTTSNTVASDIIPTSGPSVILPPSSSEPEEPSTIPVNPNHPTSRPTIPPNYDDPWQYPYDIETMYAECKAYAESVGMIWEESLDKSNSHWTTPRSTVPFTTGEMQEIYNKHLKEDTFEGINYYNNEYWPDTGEKVFTFMNIYFEPHPVYEGDYRVYFLVA